MAASSSARAQVMYRNDPRWPKVAKLHLVMAALWLPWNLFGMFFVLEHCLWVEFPPPHSSVHSGDGKTFAEHNPLATWIISLVWGVVPALFIWKSGRCALEGRRPWLVRVAAWLMCFGFPVWTVAGWWSLEVQSKIRRRIRPAGY